MKLCTRCGNTLAEDATYCYVCNTAPTLGFDEFDSGTKHSDTFLKVLCILTIAGAVFGLISTVVTIMTGAGLPIEGIKLVTYVTCVVSAGKLTGAIFMLRKKFTGLYIYTAAAILGIFMQCYSISLTSDYIRSASGIDPDLNNAILMFSFAFAILFLLAFLVMYWLPVNRRLLS